MTERKRFTLTPYAPSRCQDCPAVAEVQLKDGASSFWGFYCDRCGKLRLAELNAVLDPGARKGIREKLEAILEVVK